jgi:hypothetical protein
MYLQQEVLINQAKPFVKFKNLKPFYIKGSLICRGTASGPRRFIAVFYSNGVLIANDFL